MKETPHDLESERAVLGAVIVRNQVLSEVGPLLVEDDFFRHVHQLIWRAMQRLRGQKQAIDFITLKDSLHREGTLDEVGISYLSNLADGVPSSLRIQSYVEVVADHADRRRLMAVCRAGLESVEGDLSTATEAATSLVTAVREAVRVRGVNVFTLGDTLTGLMDSLNDPVEPITTGIESLDELGAGFRPGELTLLAGRPSHGKTALALHIAKAAANQGAAVVFASLEMLRDALALRWLASDSAVSFASLRSSRLTPTDFTRVSESIERLTALPITIDDHPTMTVADLRRTVLGQDKACLLIVDYLQLLQPPVRGRYQNRVQEIGAVSRGLKAIAHDGKVSVLALSQLNRQVETRGGDPWMSDLRDSGELEQDADSIWMVSRPALHDQTGSAASRCVLKVVKHRNGPLGRVELVFDGETQRFRERDHRDAPIPETSSDASKMQTW